MIQKVPITQVKLNPNNPRVIKDDKFKKLVKSIQDLPEMGMVRPIVVNQDMIVLGGNMRLKAMQEVGLKEVPITIVDWDEDKQRQFIIKDNIGYGEWDFDMLANEWDELELQDWGMEIHFAKNDANMDDFFNEPDKLNNNTNFKITLDYTEEEYNLVNEAFKKHSETKEQVVFKLLGL